jgi:hypothetical protein
MDKMGAESLADLVRFAEKLGMKSGQFDLQKEAIV